MSDLRVQFQVSTLRTLHRKQSYVLVLDLNTFSLDWHKLRKGIEVRRSFPIYSCLKLEKAVKDMTCLTVMFNAPSALTPAAKPNLDRNSTGQVSIGQIVQAQNSQSISQSQNGQYQNNQHLNNQSTNQSTNQSFQQYVPPSPLNQNPLSTFTSQQSSRNLSLDQSNNQSINSHPGLKSVWHKLVFFQSNDDRELFCNLVHAAIASGEQAKRVWETNNQSINQSTSHSGESDDLSSQSLNQTQPTATDFPSFLVAYCAAQQQLDTEAINESNQNLNTSQSINQSVNQSADDFHPNLKDMFGFHCLEGEVVTTQAQRVARILINQSSYQSIYQSYVDSSLVVNQSINQSTNQFIGLPPPSVRGNMFVTNYRIIFRAYRSVNQPVNQINNQTNNQSSNESSTNSNSSNQSTNQSTNQTETPNEDESSLYDCDIALGSINQFLRPNQSMTSMIIQSKDGRNVEFMFDQSINWLEGLINQLSKQCFNEDQTQSFAFAHGRAIRQMQAQKQSVNQSNNQFDQTVNHSVSHSDPSNHQSISQSNSQFMNESLIDWGWRIYDPISEYKRMGLLNHPSFRLTSVNQSYELCESYPRQFIVPKSISDESLKQIAAFRSRGRIPATVYIHPSTNCTLSRSSQPMTGLKGKRCEADEQMIEALRQASNQSNNQSNSQSNISSMHQFTQPLNHPMNVSNQSNQSNQSINQSVNQSDRPFVIIDARPYKAAMGNTVMGKGYENISHYQNTQLHFMNIDNIHGIRNSYDKLCTLINQSINQSTIDDSQWSSKLESTNWLMYIRLLLKCSVRIVQCLTISQSSVLIHCSDGWDRTSQLISLSSLMLDPSLRSINGFIRLIERDWLSFGHQFSIRNQSINQSTPDQRAPIFLQFCDCVYQLINQFPNEFEFHEHFLIALIDDCVNHRTGTFLYNHEKQRQNQSIKQFTCSAWTYLCSESSRTKYRNTLYNPSINQSIILPDTCAKRVTLWETYHYRWHMLFHQSINQTINQLMNQSIPSLNQSINQTNKQANNNQSINQLTRKMAVKYATMKTRLVEAGVDPSLFDDSDEDDPESINQSINQSTTLDDDLLFAQQQFNQLSTKQRRAMIAKTLNQKSINRLHAKGQTNRTGDKAILAAINQSNQSINQSINQSHNSIPSINQSINQSTNPSSPRLPPSLPPRPATSPGPKSSPSNNQSINQSNNQSINQSINQLSTPTASQVRENDSVSHTEWERVRID